MSLTGLPVEVGGSWFPAFQGPKIQVKRALPALHLLSPFGTLEPLGHEGLSETFTEGKRLLPQHF